ncbi:MAG: C39 family peptidase [Verrucomicrobiales bacterium]|nr:C39 family peptidase [Verrucomicrobiales bacterium]
MKTLPFFSGFLTLLFLTASLTADEYRTFTNSAGKSIEAKVEKVENGQATITLKSGQQFTIPANSLSAADQEYLATWKPASATPAALPTDGVTAAAINEVIGKGLFGESTLWDSNPEEVAGRLQWRRESKTEISESYRSYPKSDYRFLGARPFSAALYGEEEKVTGISIVFANKGDSYQTAGSGEDHFIKGKPVPGGMEGVKMLMEHDAETISESLTALLGEPERQKFGEGEARVTAERWDWAGHAFLLSNVEGEYVSLAVQTIEFADARGNTKRVPDSVVRERVRGFVETRENGDVVISNIPMVDQGPKGYCVPATAERCMRFLGISADMYLLAMAGETQAGGGTSVDRLLSNIGSDIKRKGRSFDIETGELKMRDVQRSIDDGIPIIWAMFSTKEFNEIANERKKVRSDAGSWDSYKANVAAAAEDPGLVKDTSTSHVVIIMGYNEETNEIAFSDSWGERYLERWITLPEAEQISQNRFYIIDL